MGNSLTIENVHAGYGAVRVIEDVSMQVGSGATVVLLGTNGNGKSTLIKCIMGICRPASGRIVAEIDGEKHNLVGMRPEAIVDLGIALVPEGRRLFPRLTVEDNLKMGAFMPAARARFEERLAFVFDLFPRMKERRNQFAGTMSGGEQQMCAIGRALMARPRFLLLDEPSLGLSPLIVRDLFRAMREINVSGVAVLLVEQNVAMALELARRAYVLDEGRIAAEGEPRQLMSQPQLQRAYFGIQMQGIEVHRQR